MSTPNYTIISFQYKKSDTPTILALISQTIEKEEWVITKRAAGDEALNIWNNRGESEEKLIALLLDLV